MVYEGGYTLAVERRNGRVRFRNGTPVTTRYCTPSTPPIVKAVVLASIRAYRTEKASTSSGRKEMIIRYRVYNRIGQDRAESVCRNGLDEGCLQAARVSPRVESAANRSASMLGGCHRIDLSKPPEICQFISDTVKNAMQIILMLNDDHDNAQT